MKDVRAGQRGVGRTVFSGARVEEFQVEILGVLQNLGPRESIILAKLSGGPLATTGVMQGMSGSDRKSTRLNSSHIQKYRMPSSA